MYTWRDNIYPCLSVGASTLSCLSSRRIVQILPLRAGFFVLFPGAAMRSARSPSPPSLLGWWAGVHSASAPRPAASRVRCHHFLAPQWSSPLFPSGRQWGSRRQGTCDDVPCVPRLPPLSSCRARDAGDGPPSSDAHIVFPHRRSPPFIHRQHAHFLEAFPISTRTLGKHRGVPWTAPLSTRCFRFPPFLFFTSHPFLVMRWSIPPPALHITHTHIL